MEFIYDWWFGGSYSRRVELAKRRCAASRFPDLAEADAEREPDYVAFHSRLETRTIIYLRDGFSYEVKDIIQEPSTTSFTFECMPADDAYKVGCFVVTVPFEEIVRVEIFAVHPDEKPEDMPSIKGFASAHGPPPPASRPEERSA